MVIYGQRGYSGSSKSLRAVVAENNGRLPLSRAIPVVAKLAGVTRKVARAALEFTWDGEWHHTSKYANKVDYYSVTTASNHLIVSLWSREKITVELEAAGEFTVDCHDATTDDLRERMREELDWHSE